MQAAIIEVKENFNLPIKQLWNAITCQNQMIKWFFAAIPEFEASVGFRTQFDVISGERIFTHLWEITQVKDEQQITYRWRYGGYSGDSYVTFRLVSDNGSVVLILTHEIIEAFPDHIPEFTDESCKAGWQYFINDRLKSFVDESIG